MTIEAWSAGSGPAGLSDLDIRRAEPGAVLPLNPAGLADQVLAPSLEERIRAGLEPVNEMTSARRRARALLAPVVDLPPNWDSYGGRPVDADIAMAVEDLLANIFAQGVEPPAVVPTSSGGLAVEWHRASRELAIEVEPIDWQRRRVTVFFADEVAEEVWQRDLQDLGLDDFDEAFSRVVE